MEDIKHRALPPQNLQHNGRRAHGHGQQPHAAVPPARRRARKPRERRTAARARARTSNSTTPASRRRHRARLLRHGRLDHTDDRRRLDRLLGARGGRRDGAAAGVRLRGRARRGRDRVRRDKRLGARHDARDERAERRNGDGAADAGGGVDGRDGQGGRVWLVACQHRRRRRRGRVVVVQVPRDVRRGVGVGAREQVGAAAVGQAERAQRHGARRPVRQDEVGRVLVVAQRYLARTRRRAQQEARRCGRAAEGGRVTGAVVPFGEEKRRGGGALVGEVDPRDGF